MLLIFAPLTGVNNLLHVETRHELLQRIGAIDPVSKAIRVVIGNERKNVLNDFLDESKYSFSTVEKTEEAHGQFLW